MSDLSSLFQKAQAEVKTLRTRPNNDTLLQLYALYKQGNEGDVTGKRPGMLSVEARAKFDAWEKVRGTSKPDAMQKYVDMVNRLLGK